MGMAGDGATYSKVEAIPAGQGHFVFLRPDGVWQNMDEWGPEGQQYGSVPSFFRMRRDVAVPTDVAFRYEMDDLALWFNDEKQWYNGPGVHVDGEKCTIIKARSLPTWKNSPCELNNAAPARSTIVPETGNLHFEVPITSWGYRGQTISFSLAYNSLSALDHALAYNQPKHPAALSDDDQKHNYNPKFTHTLSYTTVSTPGNWPQRKLSAVDVVGAGSPSPATYHWGFAWGGPANDFLTLKAEPSGLVVNYEHEPVTLPRQGPADYDGRVLRCYWSDSNGLIPIQREILRNGTTIVYSGGNSYTYTSTANSTTVTHDNTGASAGRTFDENRNVVAAWTNLESAINPLYSTAYRHRSEENRAREGGSPRLLGGQAGRLGCLGPGDDRARSRWRYLELSGPDHAPGRRDRVLCRPSVVGNSAGAGRGPHYNRQLGAGRCRWSQRGTRDSGDASSRNPRSTVLPCGHAHRDG